MTFLTNLQRNTLQKLLNTVLLNKKIKPSNYYNKKYERIIKNIE